MTFTPIEFADPDAKYLIVAEAPGEEEDKHKRPLIGASGQELYKMLEEAGWLPLGSAKRIALALGTFYDPVRKRLTISDRPNFTTVRRILSEASLYLTNIVHERPPNNEIESFFYNKRDAKSNSVPEIGTRFPNQIVRDGMQHLRERITQLDPTIIIALGNTSLWALVGCTGISKWRGSVLSTRDGLLDLPKEYKVIPTYHPAAIIRDFELRHIAVRDLKRAKRERVFPEVRRPDYDFITRPSFDLAMQVLDNLHRGSGPLACDIETPYGWLFLPSHIACIGFSEHRHRSICIPIMCRDETSGRSFWPAEQEHRIVLKIRDVQTKRDMIYHKGVFETMHFCRHWGYYPNWQHDTMIMQHILFPGLLGGKIDPVSGKVSKGGSSLSLAFISSMYCEYYRFWKDDGKGWDNKTIRNEDEFWRYNCEDVARTFECFEVLEQLLKRANLWEQYREHCENNLVLVSMMLKGILQDVEKREEFRRTVQTQRKTVQTWIDSVLGHSLNMRSNDAMKKLFYGDFGEHPITKRNSKGGVTVTCDGNALELIAKRTPILAPLCNAISDYRSLAVFEDNFLKMRLVGNRVLTEINPCGTETLRFSSTETPFGEGGNLQNIERMPDE